MLDFSPVRNRQTGMDELVQGLQVADLRRLTNEMIDTQLALIADCLDEDVVFVPVDPQANDPYAEREADKHIAWTLGHVIVHITASSEESAYLAAELARGALYRGGRSRYEVPWETVHSIAQCRERLEESRRMRLGSLDMWSDPPHLDNLFEGRDKKQYNAVVRFVYGLAHDDSHLDQIGEIVWQSKAARSV